MASILNQKRNFIAALAAVVTIVSGIACDKFTVQHSQKSFLQLSGIPSIPDSLRKSLAVYQNTNSASLQDWAPGGRGLVVITRAGETNQLHYTQGPRSALKLWTFGAEPISDAKVCPDSTKNIVLFTRDSGGNEQYQIFWMKTDSLNPIRLTDAKSQSSDMVWSNWGDCFAYRSNCRNRKDFDLYVSSVSDLHHPRIIWKGEGDWSVVDWSPNDSLMLVSRYMSRIDSRIFILSPFSGMVHPMHDTLDTESIEAAVWGPEGKGIFYTSDKNTDFRCLRYYNCLNNKDTILTSGISWDVREIAASRDRNRLAFTVNEHGYSRVYILDPRTFSYHEISNLPKGVIHRLRFNKTSDCLAMTINGSSKPEDVFSVSLTDLTVTQWTKSSMAGIDNSECVEPEVVFYPTFDSVNGKPRTIPCFYYKPKKQASPCPVIIFVHGGPESQFWPYFSPLIQYYVNVLGIAVLAPNIRGSGGYGRNYLTLDNGFKREDALKDIGALIDWIGAQPSLDSSRIAIKGGSYGGYVALASLERFNTKIKAGIDMYGISNFLTFLSHTAEYRKNLRRVEYGDERDPSMKTFLRKISPLSGANLMVSPLLIVQGNNDPRVPVEESLQIARAVRANNAIAWLFIAMNEGHGFGKKSNSDYQELVDVFFLQKFLLH